MNDGPLGVRYWSLDVGIYVGYRHFDKRGIDPLFAFGHGLSYTKFECSDLLVDPTQLRPGQPLHAAMRARTSGSRAGAEVVRLYLRDVASSVDRPIRELKGFQRAALIPGEIAQLNFTLGADALAFYDEKTQSWVAEPGQFEVPLGASSRDLSLTSASNYGP